MAAILNREMSVPNFKIIVFFTTARLTGFMARLFQEMGINILEIHSRKSQSQRMKTSDEFRDGSDLILFSSDVSARGMDYPDISFVLQLGLTEREQYIHRLGRTVNCIDLYLLKIFLILSLYFFLISPFHFSCTSTF